MFGKILNFRFPSVSEAKLAASFCSEKFGSKISDYNIIGLNIFISQLGDLNVSIKFENSNALNKFETNYEEIISDLKKSFTNIHNKDDNYKFTFFSSYNWRKDCKKYKGKLVSYFCKIIFSIRKNLKNR